jgi:hypothetical protein
VNLKILPICGYCNRSITIRAQKTYPRLFVTSQHCLHWMSERVRFAHGDHCDSRSDGGEECVRRGSLASMVRDLEEVSRERRMLPDQR